LLHPETSLEPVTLLVQQVDHRDRHSQLGREEPRDVVIGALRRGVEDTQPLQSASLAGSLRPGESDRSSQGPSFLSMEATLALN
jgi:hypothetical protein